MNRVQRRLREKTKERLRPEEKAEVTLKVAREAEEFAKHYVTGALYTSLGIILRKHPYRWSAEKVMRLFETLSGTVNDLSAGRISDADLVTEGEKYGIRVLWDAKHEYITSVNIFEEDTE